jgi:hypothetical protein
MTVRLVRSRGYPVLALQFEIFTLKKTMIADLLSPNASLILRCMVLSLRSGLAERLAVSSPHRTMKLTGRYGMQQNSRQVR